MKLNYLKNFNIEKLIFYWSFIIIFLLQTKSNLIYIYFLFLIFFLGIVYFVSNQKEIYKYLNIFNLSFIYITFNTVGKVFSGNNLNYLPSILKDSIGIFKNDYTANFTYPYPAFKFLTESFINLFGINSLIYLNFLSGIFVFIIFCLVQALLNKATYQLLNIFFLFFLTPGLFQFLFIKVLNIEQLFSLVTSNSLWLYKHIYLKITDYMVSGFSHFSFITNNFEPSMFDALILFSIVLFTKKKFLLSFCLAGFSMMMHTYNIVPTSVLLLVYFLKHRNIDKNIFARNLIPLIISYLFVIGYSLIYLSSPVEQVLIADQIMTYERISNHRLFNGNVTLFSLFSFNLNNFSFKIGGAYPGEGGFPFELEILFFYLLLKKLENKSLTLFFNISFFIILSSLAISYISSDNLLGAYVRTFTPWRLSLFFYFFGTIYILNYLIEKFPKSFGVLNLFFILLISIYSFIEFNNGSNSKDISLYELDKPFYRIDNFLSSNENSEYLKVDLNKDLKPVIEDNNQYLISFNESGIVFSNFISTSGNFVAHPYKSSEIVSWWNKKIAVDKIFYKELNCKDILLSSSQFGYENIAFTEKNPASTDLINCEGVEVMKVGNTNLITGVKSK